MMFSTKNLIRKANQLRKQNWSAPTIMTIFIVFCMFMVYSFETIGILNKERNIDFRITSPEKLIKTLDLNVNRMPIEKLEMNAEQVVNLNVKQISEKNREENLEKIRRIMLQGALNQLSFESLSAAPGKEVEKIADNEKIEFFDF